jgi:hypothetical protein
MLREDSDMRELQLRSLGVDVELTKCSQWRSMRENEIVLRLHELDFPNRKSAERKGAGAQGSKTIAI